MTSQLLRTLRHCAFNSAQIPTHALPEDLVRARVKITMFEGACLPYDNTKALTVLGILMGAQEAGRLEGVQTLVEATSGNTGKVLTALAPEFGINNVVQVMEPDVPYSKSFAGIAYGAKIVPPHAGLSTIETARLLGEQEGWLNLDQYSNPDGLRMHKAFTGPKILDALGEVPGMLVATIGTGTTIGGTIEYLRSRGECESVGVLLEDLEESPGMRDERGMKLVNLPWRGYADTIEKILSKESWYMSLAMTRATKMSFGASSGSAAIATMNRLRKELKSGEIELRRNKQGDVIVAVIGPDGFESYPDRYNANIHRNHSKPDVLPLPWKVLPPRYLSYVG